MKKFLNTTEEVIKELKNGKTVYEADYPFYYYKMIDGIICGKIGKYAQLSINLSIYMDAKYYIEEEEKPLTIEEERSLTIEVGKCYRTRNGKKAFCYYKGEYKLYPNHIVISNVGCHTCTEGGLIAEGEENDMDIVDYWEDKENEKEKG